MPFYRKVDKDSKKLFDRYEKVFNPNSGKYEFTHRIIAETVERKITYIIPCIIKILTSIIIHHAI